MENQENQKNNQAAKVSNDSIETGAASGATKPLKTEDDKREHNIDANRSISEMREDAEKAKGGKLADQPGDQDNGKEDDAMNYKSDRENGAYNASNS